MKAVSVKRRSVLITIGLVVAITVVAAALRLHELGTQSLWYDEAFSVYLARMSPAEITARTAADIQPPLYYYLLHTWIKLLGDEETALRGLSALFGVLSVPLIYAVGRRLFHSRLAGLLAALLLAVAPLHVWYGQETRMYTLLVLLCLLSGYLLLVIVERPRKLWVEALLWAGFALASIAALYTHYFALFVLAFQAIYVVAVWLGRGLPVQTVAGGVASGAAIGLAYLPWLPHLLARYAADASFWPGQLRVGQVLVDIVLSFVGGESIAEQPGLALAAVYGVVVLVALLGLLKPAEREGQEGGPAPYPALFLLLFLLLPPLLILVLSYNTPKFNARYVMISHPALLLLLGGGLAALLAPARQAGRRWLAPVAAGAAAVGLLVVLGVAAYADRNAYGSPDYARPDFKNAIRYLRHHIVAGEAVILTSGHQFPVFDYYAPKQARYLLPDSPTLDTTKTLDYSIGAALNEWLANPAAPKKGVWLVLWQDEVVDPVGYLAALLDEAGEGQSIPKTFPKVRLAHYTLPSGTRFPEGDRPKIAHPTDFNFGNKLRLLGYEQSGQDQVTLYWQALQPLDQDYRVSVVLRDTQGQEWGKWDGRPTAYLYPTTRWRAGQVVFGHCDLPRVPGRPPGDYGLEVGVYTEADPAGLDIVDAAGAAQGRRAMLGAVTLYGYSMPSDLVQAANRGSTQLGDGLAIMDWEVTPAEGQPGDRVALALTWQVTAQPRGMYGVQVLVTDATGWTYDAGTFTPTNEWHPTNLWQPGEAWQSRLTFRLPIRAQPGDGRLSARLIGPNGKAFGAVAELGAIRVLPTSRVFKAPVPQVPRQANLNDQVLLLGADVPAGPLAPGATLPLTLYWQALAEMDVPYTVFVNVVSAGGQPAAQHDAEPAGGTRPTTSWVPGEFVVDTHQVALPGELAPGLYVIEVGLYDRGARGLPRLPIVGSEGQGMTDRVIFGPVQIK